MKRFIILSCLVASLVVSVVLFGAKSSDKRAPDSTEKLSEDDELQRKIDVGEKLINDAVTFFNETRLGAAFRSFGEDERWYRGEFDVDVFDANGNCWIFGSEIAGLYANFKDAKKVQQTKGLASTPLGSGTIEEMVREGDQGGGWVSFEWNFATCYSYVRTAIKDGIKYILFGGIYPESPRFQIQQLVKSAIRYARINGFAATAQQINNMSTDAPFILGDGYLWMYSMKVDNLAHGRNPALVGQNMINFKDSAGRLRNQVMIDLVKKQGSGWLEYEESGIVKYTYVESFVDPTTKETYIIGGGYYPNITDDTIVTFVKRAIEYLKAQGSKTALRDFSSYAGGFVKGPLRVTAIGLDGTILADATNPIFVGQNLINIRDPEGKYVIREIIEKVKKLGRGWITFVENRAYKSMYAELVETPDGKFIIASGFWPTSKEHSAHALAEKAALHLELSPLVTALHDFTTYNNEFLKGDLFVEVYNDEGICFAYGWDRNRVWADEKKVLDSKGYPIIDRVIDIAKRGGGWVEYEMNDATRRVYAKAVTKAIPQIAEEKVKLTVPAEEIKKDKSVTRKDVAQKKTSQTFIVAVGYYV